MVVEHPIDRVPEGALRRWQIPSVAIALLFLAALPLVLPGREANTLLELVGAGSVGRAVSILEHWSPQDRVRVAYAVGFDFLMNPAYMNVLAISCVWSGRTFGRARVGALASVLAWLAWSVALTNAAENVGLFVALAFEPTSPWPLIVAAAHYWAGVVVSACVAFSLAGLARRAWAELIYR